MRSAHLLCAMLCAMLAAVPAAALAQPAADSITEARVVVSATRSSRVAADRATLYAVVEAAGESPAVATDRAERALQNVTEVAHQLGSRIERSTTTPYGVTSTARPGDFPGPSQTPYVARFVVRLETAHVDDVTDVATALLRAGATSAWPTFESSTADSVRRARYADALTQAQHDAEAMAASLGRRLGAIIEASTNGPGVETNQPPFDAFGRRLERAAPLPSPDVPVSVTVTVRYRLLPAS